MSSNISLNQATLAEDRTLLGPWAEAFAVVCGSPVVRTALTEEDPDAGQRLTFPRVFQPIELVGGTGHFRHNPAMSEQVQRMGFAWESDGRILTMPSPGAFNLRLAAVGIPGSGFRLSYANGNQAKMPLGPWLLRYMQGVITLLVNAPSFYEPMRRGELPPRLRDRTHWGFTSVAHDISVHALNYHLIPLTAVEDLAERIRRAVPERYASWSQPEALAPLTLTYFFDNDFNRYAYAVWCRCQRPHDFAGLFLAPKNFQQLVAALDVRLQETKAGRGDVASGDFNEVGKLADTTFEVA